MQSKFKRLASDTAIFAIGNVLVKLIQFFLLPLYTSAMTTDQYGIAELINNLSELCYPIFCVCIYEALFRLAMDAEIDKKNLFTNGIAILFITFPLATVVMFFFYRYAEFQYAWYLLVLLIVISLRTIFAQFARGIGYIKEFAISGVINVLALFAFNMFFLVHLHMGISAYLISLALGNLVSMVYLLLWCKLYKYLTLKIDKKLLSMMLLYCLPLIPNTFTWWFMNIFDRYVILFACGAELAGIFTAACKLPSIINLCSTVFQQAWQISSTRELESEDSSKFFSSVFSVYSGFVITVCSFLIVISKILAMILLKGDFFDGWHYLPLLMLSALINCYAIYFGTIYNAVKKTSKILSSTILGTIINIVIVFAMVKYIGVYAALFSMLIGYSCIATYRGLDSRKYIRINIDKKYHIIAGSIIIVQTAIISLNMPCAFYVSALLWIALVIIDFKEYGTLFKHVLSNIIKKERF